MMPSEALRRCVEYLGLPANGFAHNGAAVLWSGLVLLALIVVIAYVLRRAYVGVLTLRAMALTPLFSRLLSQLVKSRDYSNDAFFGADGADARWVEVRRKAIDRLAAFFRMQSPKSIAWGDRVREGFSDLRFTDANRVPFPFMRVMREKFNLCTVVTASDGPRLRDLDGNWSIDVSGSYGLNVAGFDRYKDWMEKGLERVNELGPVLGPLHPVVAENIEIIKTISKLDEVSFHMSGTEAVMAAVRMARFNTRRKFIVSFSGAYHGWWDGVQPGLGSERDITDCLSLKDVNSASLDLIRLRAHEIAAVLINPIQSFHPNSPPPSDTVLLTSSVRKTQGSTTKYAEWLRKLRQLCTECAIPLIFDEVFSGFRLAPGGAQEFYGVQADMVIYGKTIAGGMPIGVVCGKKELMRRFDPAHPMRIAYVIGTFSAHPVVMGAMNEFLHWIVKPEASLIYADAKQRCEAWVRSTNQSLAERALPVRVVNLGTVWTVLFKEPGRYNWLLQYYLRAQGVTLSWVGTGRCMTSLDFNSEDYLELEKKLVGAAWQMKTDGWWLSEVEQPRREKVMRSNLIREMLGSIVRIPEPVKGFYAEIMQRKHDDHEASHSNLINQFFHLLSSSTFMYCYFLIFTNLTRAMTLGLIALFVRQFGHAILEPPCHDKEEKLLGFNTPNKTLIVGGYLLIPIINIIKSGSPSYETLISLWPAIAAEWLGLTVLAVMGRVVYLAFTHDFRSSMIWFVKLITDPFTDLIAYYGSVFRLLQWRHAERSEAA